MGPRVKQCSITEKAVKIVMENHQYQTKPSSRKETRATSLAAPIAGFMDARIEESMKASN